LDQVGLLGPDEPRYASIGRHMAQSSDWITPRLWGEPWFEKPPLLYWMIGVAFRMGLSQDLAPRLPNAVLGVAFLAFYYLLVRREFGSQSAFYSAGILAASAGWLGFAHVGATDLPLTATFSAAMFLVMAWLRTGERLLPAAAAISLALAVLAKGLVALALALPVLWFARRHFRQLLRPEAVLGFLITAVPWYALAAWRHGSVFWQEFFVRHHFQRFSSDALQHQQPFWFYVPVLAAGLFPWCALLLLLRRLDYRDPRLQFLAAWVAWGLVFLSASLNKLPGYVLPLLPALALLCGLALAHSRRCAWTLGASALLLGLLPLIAQVLPKAIQAGLSRAEFSHLRWEWPAAAVALAVTAMLLEWRRRRQAAFLLLLGALAASVTFLKTRAFPQLDTLVSARALWKQIEPHQADCCVESLHRAYRYGLNYYSQVPLPDCISAPRPLHVIQDPGMAPRVEAAPSP